MTIKYSALLKVNQRVWVATWWCDFCPAQGRVEMGYCSAGDHDQVAAMNKLITTTPPPQYFEHVLNDCPSFKRSGNQIVDFKRTEAMMCDSCKKAADDDKFELHCGKPGEVSVGCYCQHHPVGSRQFFQYQASISKRDPGRRAALRMLARAEDERLIEDVELPAESDV